MADQSRFIRRYEQGETPWDIGRPDPHLVTAVHEHEIRPGRALEIGCGTGDNALWLARRGFDVVACDLSPLAIDRAREKADRAGIDVDLRVLDYLGEPLDAGVFDFACDRGCFHSFHDPEDRVEFARRTAALLAPGGGWWSMIGNADEKDREGDGPPQLSAREITGAVEDHFEILSLRSEHFANDQPPPPRGWVCWMRRRD